MRTLFWCPGRGKEGGREGGRAEGREGKLGQERKAKDKEPNLKRINPIEQTAALLTSLSTSLTWGETSHKGVKLERDTSKSNP